MLVARMLHDFENRYGYEPWLIETFVDTSHHPGTCYRAANWIRVGSTSGRGRQDRERSEKTVKDMYVWAVADDFRNRLGLPAFCWSGSLTVRCWLGNRILGPAGVWRRIAGGYPGRPTDWCEALPSSERVPRSRFQPPHKASEPR